MIKRKALESLKPDVVIEVHGKKVKISNVTSVKTAVQEWTLDEPSKYDPGSGTEETFINSVEVFQNNRICEHSFSYSWRWLKPSFNLSGQNA